MNRFPTHHPCFDPEVRHQFGRIHLPVAPKCNIQCNFCNRKYDCLNESRPGVTSAVLQPEQAILYLEEVLRNDPRITVVGVAGPGDPFANPKETLKTFRLIRERFPRLTICVASNGLNVLPYIQELAELNVTHFTVTMNAIDPEIGAKIYAWVRYAKSIYRGTAGAELLIERQLETVRQLKAHGFRVKVNSILIPGVNENEIERVASRVAELRADYFNCIPVYPTAGTIFEKVIPVSDETVNGLRERLKQYLPQMAHCTRCRADAVGLLGEGLSDETAQLLAEYSRKIPGLKQDRPYIAVASREGFLVNLHLGEAESLQIFAQTAQGLKMIETRTTPAPGGGKERWLKLAQILGDCRAVLASGAGESPRQTLSEQGIQVIETAGIIEQVSEAVFNGTFIPAPRRFVCGESCRGDGLGCG
jgi:nitrogen fixation protein NifB